MVGLVVVAEYIAESKSNYFLFAIILVVTLYVASFVACIYYLFGTRRVESSRIGWLLAIAGAFLVGFFPVVLPFFWYFKVRESSIPKPVT